MGVWTSDFFAAVTGPQDSVGGMVAEEWWSELLSPGKRRARDAFMLLVLAVPLLMLGSSMRPETSPSTHAVPERATGALASPADASPAASASW